MAIRSPGDLANHLLASGVSSFTVEDAVRETGQSPDGTRGTLKRLIDRGDVVSPARGFYVPVSPEHRAWGGPPAVDYIDSMMRHLDRVYYVALLSAAELHGVAHQRPQVFQVVTDRQLAARQVGRTHLRFYTTTRLSRIPAVERNSRTGTIRMSSVEATMFDLAFRPTASGGLDNVATIFGELLEEQLIDMDRLGEAADVFPSSAVRRVGWLLERLGGVEVRDRIAVRATEPTLLDPHGGRRGHIDPAWQLIVNADVTPDL